MAKESIMTQNELKKLHRIELLELLIEQTKRADTLEEEVAELKARLAAREIDIQNAGTLAEAAIKVNEVLAAADAAAKQYLYNVMRITGNLPEEPGTDEIEKDPRNEQIENADESVVGQTEEESGNGQSGEEAEEGKKSKAGQRKVAKRGKGEKPGWQLRKNPFKKKEKT